MQQNLRNVFCVGFEIAFCILALLFGRKEHSTQREDQCVWWRLEWKRATRSMTDQLGMWYHFARNNNIGFAYKMEIYVGNKGSDYF